MDKTSIKEYFRGKNVFITGGSGFLGKALIEKLLRSCPDIGTIYILLRTKKGKSPYDRIEDIISSPLFEQLRQKNPENIKKIIPMIGDTSVLGLGLSQEDKMLLTEKVHIFVHAAASVRFDDFLKQAIFNNVRSAREAAALALEMKRIEVFIHISTTYCNIHKKEIKEILYPSQGNWREAIDIAGSCDSQTLNVLSRKYIGHYPNTYTYTKLMAEHCINDLLVGKIATVICRPSVVVSSIADPFPGWLDNFNGPVSLMLAGGSGILRTVYGKPELVTDYIAVDNVVKLIVVAGWHTANFRDKNSLAIYHSSQYNTPPITQQILLLEGRNIYWDVPLEKKIWYPGGTITICWYNYFLNVILFHLIPAIVLDLIIKIAGYQPMLLKMQRKIYISNMAVSTFMLNEWDFINKKADDLFDSIPHAEREEFNFHIVPIDARSRYEYYKTSADYARIHLMKESTDITTATRVKTRRMYYLDRALKLLFLGLAVWIVFFKAKIPKLVIDIICNYWDSL